MVYLLPFLAIFIGYLLSNYLLKDNNNKTQYLLSFSGSFLLSITFFELLPELIESYTKVIALFIMIGLLLQIVLDFFSKGAEHGHIHINNSINSFPFFLFISLSIHSLIEGFPINAHNNILWGVVIHKIPIAMILTYYFKKSNLSKLKTYLFLILFALMTPVGSFIALETNLLNNYIPYVTAISIGIFLHVSTTILFESSKEHKFNLIKLFTIIAGVIVAYLL